MAEREDMMIEIIQEENWDVVQDRQGMPKNIKQIGEPDMGDRIYIEDNAYRIMHPYGRHAEKMVYVMLGRFDDFAGHTCIFVEDVVEMHEIAFRGNLPVWNEESWGHLYRKLRPDHEDMIIVGWAVDVCGQSPNMSAQLERIHQTYFGGVHQVLFLMDTMEREEAFFGNGNGYLKRRTGFYVYYDKTIPSRMESAMEALREEQSGERYIESHEDDRKSHRQEQYREYLNQRNARNGMPQPPQRESHSLTLLLLVVIVALGYSAFQNHQRMQEMELALSQMSGVQNVMQSGTAMTDGVRVEDVIGSVASTQTSLQTPSTQVPSSQVPSTQVPSTQVPSTQVQSTQVPSTQVPSTQIIFIPEPSTQIFSEADTYLAQGYYIVQKGDNLASICEKIYHTTAMMEKVCQANGIENPNAIYVGQYLELPR